MVRVAKVVVNAVGAAVGAEVAKIVDETAARGFFRLGEWVDFGVPDLEVLAACDRVGVDENNDMVSKRVNFVEVCVF